MELEQVLWFYGFRECKADDSINILKLSNGDYLIMKIFKKSNTVDLIHAKFETGESPCTSEPIWEESVKLSFSPRKDDHILKSFLEKFKNK